MSIRFPGTSRLQPLASMMIFYSCLNAGISLHAGTAESSPVSVEEATGSGDWELELKSTAGWQSNPFEVGNHYEKPKGDGFVYSSLDSSCALDGPDGAVTGTFSGSEKRYFREDQLDEYELKSAMNWRLLDVEEVNLTIDLRGSRFRERIYDEFQSKPNRSAVAWSGGAGWKLQSDLSDEVQITWEGGGDYQTFDQVRLDNLKLGTSAEFQCQWSDDLTWICGVRSDFQNYPVRPPESESPGLESGLKTFEARLFTGIDSKLGHGWTLEIAGNGGPIIDLTNGYFNARELGAHVELRWQMERWKLQASAEPNWVWFEQRPANRTKRGRKLVRQEELLDASVEYSLTKNLSLLGHAIMNLQYTNSKQATDDATLGEFADLSVQGGVSLVF